MWTYKSVVLDKAYRLFANRERQKHYTCGRRLLSPTLGYVAGCQRLQGAALTVRLHPSLSHSRFRSPSRWTPGSRACCVSSRAMAALVSQVILTYQILTPSTPCYIGGRTFEPKTYTRVILVIAMWVIKLLLSYGPCCGRGSHIGPDHARI